jgi:signal transduction histidine kinase
MICLRNKNAPDIMNIESTFYDGLTKEKIETYENMMVQAAAAAKECGGVYNSPFANVNLTEYTSVVRDCVYCSAEVVIAEIKHLKNYLALFLELYRQSISTLTRKKLDCLYEISQMLQSGVLNKYFREDEYEFFAFFNDLHADYFVAFGKPAEVSIQPYDAATLLDQMLAEHILLLKEQGYVLKAENGFLLPTGAQLLTDAPQLMRMIDNIFSNIVKYADASAPIVIGDSLDNDYICLHFRNKIRADSAHVESTGIGLKTCSRIASAIGARFTVSKEDGLFTVSLALPLMKEPAPEQPPALSTRTHRHRHGGKERRPS